MREVKGTLKSGQTVDSIWSAGGGDVRFPWMRQKERKEIGRPGREGGERREEGEGGGRREEKREERLLCSLTENYIWVSFQLS
jgi:hypothetical protein